MSHESEKRRLRLAIARSRRRIDRRLRGSSTAAGRLASWKTYARRWPGLALAAGLGAGWILAAGFRPRLLVGLLGSRLVRELSGQAADLLVRELRGFWSSTEPHREQTPTEGGKDG
ncbi:MAG: hypothetical protein ACYC6Y_20235 [Thermoguttaceae bacterium]